MDRGRHLTTLAAAAAIAIVVALFVAGNVPTDLLYPERCGPSSLLGEMCIKYDSALGRYEYPPPGIPYDSSRMSPSDEEHATNLRWIAGIITFGLTVLGAWLLTRAASGRGKGQHVQDASARHVTFADTD